MEESTMIKTLRSIATTIVAISGASVAIYGGFLFVVEPRAIEWTTEITNNAVNDMREKLELSERTLERLDNIVKNLETSVTRIQEQSLLNNQTAWRFSIPDTFISDGGLGAQVAIRTAGFKLRECGVPVIDLYFVDEDEIYHRFQNPSILTSDGRAVAFPVDATRLQSLNYLATIPENENIRLGRARGYVSMTFPVSCPHVPPSIAGPLHFRIAE